MFQRTLFLPLLLLLLLFNTAFHRPALQKDPWAELEKGLRLCNVEISVYERCCYISESERERIEEAMTAPVKMDPEGLPSCSWWLRGGYEKGELLFQICGADRAVCNGLWQQFAGVVGPGRMVGPAWAVEGYLGENDDPVVRGKELIRALGGQLQQVNASSRMVQMLAYLPWAEEGYLLERRPVNLVLELNEDDYRGKIRIRLGIPVLLSPSNVKEEGTATWIDS